jgi:hypothetical protein
MRNDFGAGHFLVGTWKILPNSSSNQPRNVGLVVQHMTVDPFLQCLVTMMMQ